MQKTTLAVQQKCHPDYDAMSKYWEDCYYLISKGDAETVKAQGDRYLPKLISQLKNNSYQGKNEYAEYKSNAVWSEIPRESVNNILGEMFAKPSALKLPSIFEPYKSNITNDGNGLNILEAEISIGQLEASKIGVMAFVNKDETGSQLPKTALYKALDIFNYHQVLNPKTNEIVYDLVELRSQSYDMDPETLEYSQVTKYIIHGVSRGGFKTFKGKTTKDRVYYKVTLSDEEYLEYKEGGFEKRALHPSYIEPEFRGYNLDYVPFVVINASNVDGASDIPVLYSQVDLSLHAYKISALFMKKFKQQVWALLTGSGYSNEAIDQAIKSDGCLMSNIPGATAAYITPGHESLIAMENTWNKMKDEARAKGIQISEKTQVESGIALEKRINNQSNAFRRIVEVRNEGILKLFSYIIDWGSLGLTVENEWIRPFTDFNMAKITSDDMLKRGALVNQGNNTEQDYFNFLKRNNETQFETYEEWKAELKGSDYQG